MKRSGDVRADLRPLLIYDGDCGFCTTSVRFAQRCIRPRCAVTPWQFADLASFGISQQRAEYEILWVTSSGTVHGGSQAVAKLLMGGRGGWVPLGALLTLPGVRWIARGLYRTVAAHRWRLPGGTAACRLPAERRPTGTG